MKFKFLLILLVLASCKLSKNHSKTEQKYFEGTIEYDITYESLNDNFPTSQMVGSLPDRAILYFDKGSTVNEFFLNDTLIKRTWYNQLTNLNYYSWGDSDTLYYSNPAETDFNVDAIQQSEGERILNFPTTQIKVLCSGKKGTDYEGNQNKLILHASLELPVNPDWYQNTLEFGYNRTMRLAPGAAVKTEFVIFNYQKTISTATEIEWKEVELDLTVDSTKVLVRI